MARRHLTLQTREVAFAFGRSQLGLELGLAMKTGPSSGCMLLDLGRQSWHSRQ